MTAPLITVRVEAAPSGGYRYARYVGAACTHAWLCDHHLTAEEVEQIRLSPEDDSDPEDDAPQVA